ncbi:MAG: hypothetical protein J6A94_07725 [Lachnospiraceae bacterium]|nr:hypothetical protein [Lachnospiraceae bacterium]
MVELRIITKENLEEVLNLSVYEYQESFVSSTAYSLAQAYVYHETAFSLLLGLVGRPGSTVWRVRHPPFILENIS